ncbi:MAG: hypothetical protein ACLFUT_12240, partial [Desulfobacteraceae bacterium]
VRAAQKTKIPTFFIITPLPVLWWHVSSAKGGIPDSFSGRRGHITPFQSGILGRYLSIFQRSQVFDWRFLLALNPPIVSGSQKQATHKLKLFNRKTATA